MGKFFKIAKARSAKSTAKGIAALAGGLGAFTGLMYANTKTPWGKKSKKKRDVRVAKKYVKTMTKRDYAVFKFNQAAAAHNSQFTSKAKNPKKFTKSQKKISYNAAVTIKEYESYKKIKPRTGKLTSLLMSDYMVKKNKGKVVKYEQPRGRR